MEGSFDIPPGETIWRAYYVEWKGKKNIEETPLTTPTTFSRAYDAAVKKIRRERNRLEWREKQKKQREQEQRQECLSPKKEQKESLLKKDVDEEDESQNDQLSLF